MKFYAIGGYNEVGKNMSAVEIGEDIVIFDMGIHLENIIPLEEEERNVSTRELIELGALPDDTILKDKLHKVKAIIISHGHLDHAGAVAKMAQRYQCPIIGTPYTVELLRKFMKDEGVRTLTKKLYTLQAGESVSISKGIDVEFVHMTHSIPHTVLVALHTKEGIVT